MLVDFSINIVITIQVSQVEYLIDILVFSSFCVDRKKKQERTANTLRRRTNGLSCVWLRNSRHAAQTVLARDDTEKPHLLPTAPAIVRPANTPPLGVADLRSRFDNDLFFSNRFELAELEKIEKGTIYLLSPIKRLLPFLRCPLLLALS